jgi:hypothetical protein
LGSNALRILPRRPQNISGDAFVKVAHRLHIFPQAKINTNLGAGSSLRLVWETRFKFRGGVLCGPGPCWPGPVFGKTQTAMQNHCVGPVCGHTHTHTHTHKTRTAPRDQGRRQTFADVLLLKRCVCIWDVGPGLVIMAKNIWLCLRL